jgi:hypothetical protein
MKACLFACVLASTFAITATTVAQSEDPAATICKAILSKPLDPEPELDPSFPPDCDSSSYYFGIGRPTD